MNRKCPFIVELKYAFQTPDKLYFVVEYANGGKFELIQANFSIIFAEREDLVKKELNSTLLRFYWH